MVYCTKCGTKNEEDAVWCVNCGESLTRQGRMPKEEPCFGRDREQYEEEICFGRGRTYVGIIVGVIILLIGVILALTHFYALSWENVGSLVLVVFGILIIVVALLSFRLKSDQ